MKGDKVAGQTPTPNGQPEEQGASPGVNSLLRGKHNVFAEPEADSAEQPAAPKKKHLIPLWYFFAADVLLIFFAALILWKTPSPGWKEISFCIGAIALGGVLSVIAVLKRRLDSE